MPESNENLSYILNKQGKNLKEGEDYTYLNVLAEAIAASPPSWPIRGSYLDYQKAQDFILKAMLGQINRLLTKPDEHQRLSTLANKSLSLGFDITQNNLSLLPVNPNNIPFKPNILIHNGYLQISNDTDIKQKINNLDNITQSGIFGNPDLDKPTYLQIYETSTPVKQNVNPHLNQSQPVCLYIDAQTLIQNRSLYPDPEGLINEQEFGKSFFVTGGIPTSSIIAVSHHLHSPVISIKR